MESFKRVNRNTWIGIAVGVVALLALVLLLTRSTPPVDLKLSEFEQKVSTGQVRTATMLARDSVMTGELVDGTSFTSTFPKEYSDNLTQTLLDKNVELKVDAQRDTVSWMVVKARVRSAARSTL